LAGVNSGIEPYFAFEYERTDRTGKHKVVAKIVEEYKNANSDSALPDYFVTANDLSVEDHILMQAAAQKYIDSSVSKTINAPYEQTVDEVEKAYTLAYDAGLKSIAYFRDGCGRDQVLKKVETNGVSHENGAVVLAGQPSVPAAGGHVPIQRENYTRSAVLYGHTSRVVTDIGTAFITVNRKDDNTPCEVFINIGKGGTDLSELSEAIGRLISIALQQGVSAEQIRDQLFGVGGYSKFIKSLPTAIAIALGEGRSQTSDGELDQPVQDGNIRSTIQPILDSQGINSAGSQSGNGVIGLQDSRAKTTVLSGRASEACPDCKSFSLNHMEGCLTCGYCGYSRC
jgi:ribonucleoside-diphosphate reductase alpha chain